MFANDLNLLNDSFEQLLPTNVKKIGPSFGFSWKSGGAVEYSSSGGEGFGGGFSPHDAMTQSLIALRDDITRSN